MTQEHYEALAEIRYLGRKFMRFSRDLLLAKTGLNPEQYEALLAIKVFSAQDLTISQLSERLQVKHHSAVNIVDRLVERKLIVRRTTEKDRRKRHLVLTREGHNLIEELAGVHYQELGKRSEDMITALQRLARRMRLTRLKISDRASQK